MTPEEPLETSWKEVRPPRFTVTLEQLQSVDHIVTHKDCADGIASAMILKDVLGGAKVTFLQHNSPEQKAFRAEPGQLWCDFTPTRERVQEFVEAGAIVLDHHKFARDVVDAFGGNGIFADETKDPGVCGAVLAYRHVWLPLEEAMSSSPGMGHARPYPVAEAILKDFATLAGIRDTWQKQDPRWKDACEQAEALKFWPLDVIVRAPLTSWPGLVQPVGQVLFAKNLEYADHLAQTAYRFVSSKGTRVIIFSGVSMSSDAAEAAGDTADIIVGFSYKTEESGKPILIFSTRSHTDFNCGEFCLAHGGGGHTKAAGFSVPLDLQNHPNPFEHFRQVLEAYQKRT